MSTLTPQLEMKVRSGSWSDDSGTVAQVGRKDVFHQRLYRGDGFASAFCQSNFGDCIGDPPEFIRQVKHADGSESKLVTGFETEEEYDRAELNSLLLGYAKITSMEDGVRAEASPFNISEHEVPGYRAGPDSLLEMRSKLKEYKDRHYGPYLDARGGGSPFFNNKSKLQPTKYAIQVENDLMAMLGEFDNDRSLTWDGCIEKRISHEDDVRKREMRARGKRISYEYDEREREKRTSEKQMMAGRTRLTDRFSNVASGEAAPEPEPEWYTPDGVSPPFTERGSPGDVDDADLGGDQSDPTANLLQELEQIIEHREDLFERMDDIRSEMAWGAHGGDDMPASLSAKLENWRRDRDGVALMQKVLEDKVNPVSGKLDKLPTMDELRESILKMGGTVDLGEREQHRVVPSEGGEGDDQSVMREPTQAELLMQANLNMGLNEPRRAQVKARSFSAAPNATQGAEFYPGAGSDMADRGPVTRVESGGSAGGRSSSGSPSRSPPRSRSPSPSRSPPRSRSPSPSRSPPRSRSPSPSHSPPRSRSPSPSHSPSPRRGTEFPNVFVYLPGDEGAGGQTTTPTHRAESSSPPSPQFRTSTASSESPSAVVLAPPPPVTDNLDSGGGWESEI